MVQTWNIMKLPPHLSICSRGEDEDIYQFGSLEGCCMRCAREYCRSKFANATVDFSWRKWHRNLMCTRRSLYNMLLAIENHRDAWSSNQKDHNLNSICLLSYTTHRDSRLPSQAWHYNSLMVRSLESRRSLLQVVPITKSDVVELRSTIWWMVQYYNEYSSAWQKMNHCVYRLKLHGLIRL